MKKINEIKNNRVVVSGILCFAVLLPAVLIFQAWTMAFASGSYSSNQLTIVSSITTSPTPPKKPAAPEPTPTPFDTETTYPILGTSDVDCDGVLNQEDNCLFTYNPNQKDKNKNGVGDACEPDYGDKKVFFFACDRDGDGVGDENDNCPAVCNPDQKDANDNKVGDVCDSTLPDQMLADKPCAKRIKLKIPKWLKKRL